MEEEGDAAKMFGNFFKKNLGKKCIVSPRFTGFLHSDVQDQFLIRSK